MRFGLATLALAVPLVAIAAAAVASTKQSPPQSAVQPNRFAWELLSLHNAERDRIGTPRLTWSNRLAGEAHLWAAQLAREGQMRHASPGERRGAGENLWMGAAGYYGPEVMIGAFAAEKRHYVHSAFPDVSRTGQWADVGHYTQMVWRDTQEVGCAVARGARDDFLVCRYWPAGNWYGRMAY